MCLGYQAGPGSPGDRFILCSIGGKGTLVDVVVLGSQLRLLPGSSGAEQSVSALLITQNKRPNED